MDKKYLDTLKSFDMRPKKVKVVENKEEILLEQPNNGMTDLHAEIIKWITANPKASLEDATVFSKQLGIDMKELDHHIFMILADVLTQGKSKGKDINPDAKELEMGIKVEMEHTTIVEISRKIAMDHLSEIPDYYTRLAKMEKAAGVEHH